MVLCPPFRWSSSKGGFSLNRVQRTRPAAPERRETIVIIGDGMLPDFEKNNIITRSPSPYSSTGPDSKKPSNGSVYSSGYLGSNHHSERSTPRGSGSEMSDERKASAGRKTIADLVAIGNVNKDKTQANKRRAIIAAPVSDDSSDLQYDKFPKDDRSAEQISKAVMANDFLKNLMDQDRLTAVVEAMNPQEYPAGSLIIREGESGSHLFVSAHGRFEVLKGGHVVKTFGAGEAFGELAILYKAKRFASIRCITEAKVWILERRVFQKIMVRSGRQEQEDNIRFLASVPLLREMHPIELTKISGFLKREFFSANTAIVKQGDRGDKFYIIRGGTVVVSIREGEEPEKRVGTLGRGDYFGEQALLHKDRRLATVTAQPPGVECLTLERGPFTNLLGQIDELLTTQHPEPGPSTPNKTSIVKSEFEYVELKDLEIIGTMGVGGFGRVELVHYKPEKSLTFALKCLKKVDVVQLQQQEHVYNEKHIMMTCDSSFLVKLYRTYKDNKYIYFLMEPVLGGDVWTILQKQRFFAEPVGRFMAACVVEAFQYLHSKDIVYRDLKPENLMLDKKGYVKLVDFGFAKRIPPTSKTWTFAGTPEYVAPEIVLNKGHDRAVDFWALGVLIHELLVGKPPFRATGGNHMKTYTLILRGLDTATFHPRVTPSAKSLVRKLCRVVPAERLGYLKNGMADVKGQKWFLGLDWDGLREQTVKAPLVPRIANDWDLSNFEKYSLDKMPPDENSGWDIDF